MFNIQKYNTLFDMHTTIIGSLPAIFASIQMILAIGAILYMGSKIWSSYAKNEALDLWSLLRPFVVFFFCLNFTLITEAVELCMSPVNSFAFSMPEKIRAAQDRDLVKVRSAVKKTAAAKTEASNAFWKSMLPGAGNSPTSSNPLAPLQRPAGETQKAIMDQNLANLKQTDEADKEANMALESITSAVEGEVQAENEKWYDYIIKGIFFIVKFIIKLLLEVTIVLLLASRTIALVLLYILGPLALALTLIPGWGSNFLSWLGKYISVWLWLPVLQIVVAAMILVEYVMVKQINTTVLFSDVSFVDRAGYYFLSFCLSITGAYCIKKVPEFTGYLIPQSASDIFSSGVKGALATAGAYVGSVAGGMVGAGMKMAGGGNKGGK